jgi:cell fate (sporulation/competence/biofilm development) regulator YlbF (YheA/YmcA/DUF963 family)
MQEAAEALITNLLASEEFIHYLQSLARLNEDPVELDLLNQLSQAQANLRKKQANGGVTQSEVDTLRVLQEQVQHNKIIITYTHTQQDAINLLRAINDEISQLLGINFASFANHSTC